MGSAEYLPLKDSIAARVVLKDQQPALIHCLLTNPVTLDNFLQVPTLYLDYIASCPPQEAFIYVQVHSLQLSPDFLRSSSWDVLATSAPMNSNQQYTCDIFVTDNNSMNRCVAFGAKCERIAMALFARRLSPGEQPYLAFKTDFLSLALRVDDGRFSALNQIPLRDGTENAAGEMTEPKSSMESREVHTRSTEAFTPSESTCISSKTTSSAGHQREQMERKLLNLLSEITDVAPGGLVGKSSLDKLGIDALLTTDVVSEIDSAFGISIPQDALQSLLHVNSIVDCLYRHDGGNSFRGPADEFALLPHLEDTGATATLKSMACANSKVSTAARPIENISPFINAPDDFENIKPEFDKLADKYHFRPFFFIKFTRRTPVLSWHNYTAEAFAEPVVRFDTLTPGDTIPLLHALPTSAL